MKKTLSYFLSGMMLLILSCDEKIVIVNCSDCTAEEPKTTDIQLILEPETSNYSLVKVYRGVLEDSILIDSFTTESVDYSYKADVNVRYTFTAEYFSRSGITIVAVNSAYPRVRYEKKQCENPCYFVYNNKVNLRVKYH